MKNFIATLKAFIMAAVAWFNHWAKDKILLARFGGRLAGYSGRSARTGLGPGEDPSCCGSAGDCYSNR